MKFFKHKYHIIGISPDGYGIDLEVKLKSNWFDLTLDEKIDIVFKQTGIWLSKISAVERKTWLK